jgi:soluble lytic murein transglycosylase
MKAVSSPTPVARLASGCMVVLVFLLMMALPAAARSAGRQDAAPAGAASAKTHKPTAKPKQKAKSPVKAGTKATSSTGKATARPATSTVKASTKSAVHAAVKRPRRHHPQASREVRRARTARIKLAFVASTELRPMAQQLATLRTPAAYAGVTQFAHHHTGEAAAAAYLSLGHAYLLDKRYAEAVASFSQARQAGEELADYADFLSARANHEAGNDAAAEASLHGFDGRYPDSIFVDQAPELEAETLLAMNDAAGAQRVLTAAADTPAADRSGYQLAEAQVAFVLEKAETAEALYKKLLLAHPLSPEAQTAWAKLSAMGAESSLTTAELHTLGDAYYNAGRYADASVQYRTLARQSSLDATSRNGFAVSAAACDLKLKRLTMAQARLMPDTNDEDGARRLYILTELARNTDDLGEQKSIVVEMESRFPKSQWLAEALYSTGNTYLLRRDYATAAGYYGDLATRFPTNKHAATAHWRASWLTYRQGLYADAAHLFDEQIRLYPGAAETVAAIYWRGRLYETQDHKPAQAAADYRTLIRAYQRFFYGQMAQQRLAAMGDAPPVDQPAQQAQLDRFQAQPVPVLEESFPVESPHLAKARLLANAGLNDYIAQEIGADPDSSSWSALAEGQIYASYGEHFRALRALRRALPSATTASIKSIPLPYWRILFPEPWWETIEAESAKNNLDPYLVASLIRQESEFNPSAISPANAYGLMQLLPSVGKSMAHEEGMKNFQTFQLLDPATNIRLGTRYLRQTLNRFGGVKEYALAAYNAGGERVSDWQAGEHNEGIDEFVESIPFSETRIYVENILRDIAAYRAIDEFAASQNKTATGAGR